MTKARARAADDEGDEHSSPSDPVLACLGPVRPAPRELHCSPTAADGTPACKLFMRGKACRSDCAYAHDPPSLRQPCWTFARYGVCPRDVAREKDPEATPCWFPHNPASAASPEKRPHLALQCELGVADRVARRCRDLLGEDAVVDAARLNLARAADCVIFVRSGAMDDRTIGGTNDASDGGVFSAARALARDPHLMATLKRAYCVSVDGVDPADAHGAGSISVTGDSRESLLRAVSAAVPELLRGVAARTRGGGGGAQKKMLVKARCFPRWAAPATYAGIEPSTDDARLFEPTAKHATHVLDVVCARNRATLTLWPAEAVEAASETREDVDEDETSKKKRDGDGDDDDDAKKAFVSRLGTSTVLPYPTVPPRRLATLEYLVAQHCERVKEARAEKKPMCRAYFKLEEAADRASLPISAEWKCVDVGAAPGGWTQWISDRLVSATEGDREENAHSECGGVWAVDPGNLELSPFPANVTHVQKKAELAVADGSVPRNDVSLLVCDANGSPELVTNILLEAKPALRRGAFLVTTFKNFCRGYVEWRRQMAEARKRFKREGFEETAFFHSFANCAQEFTYVARFTENAGDESAE
jgi:hypothetical protein